MGFSRIYFIGTGGGPPPPSPVDKVVFPITQADLVLGVFTALHNLANAYVTFALYNDLDVVTQPDDAFAVDANTFSIDLTNFQPIPGTWHLVVIG